jgi:TRAP-type C4-dicarboxylate transport system permease large subunit
VLFYLIMGLAINVIPLMLLTLPAIFPTVLALGFDPVWFGVVMVVLLEAGQITPPVGIVVFAIAAVTKDVPMMSIFRRIVPFFLCMLVMILLLVLFPGMATWLPNLLM